MSSPWKAWGRSTAPLLTRWPTAWTGRPTFKFQLCKYNFFSVWFERATKDTLECHRVRSRCRCCIITGRPQMLLHGEGHIIDRWKRVWTYLASSGPQRDVLWYISVEKLEEQTRKRGKIFAQTTNYSAYFGRNSTKSHKNSFLRDNSWHVNLVMIYRVLHVLLSGRWNKSGINNECWQNR